MCVMRSGNWRIRIQNRFNSKFIFKMGLKAVYFCLSLFCIVFLMLWLSPQESSCQTLTQKAETIMLPGRIPLELVRLRAGTFLMGQNHCEQDAYPNKETPRHPVIITQSFWIGKYEITKEQWKAVM